MECPYCGAELITDDYYGRGIPGSRDFKKQGDIFKCPNRDGFDDAEAALAYIKENNMSEDPLEVCCDSSCFNGFFYTDSSGNLHEGYPC